MRRSLVLALSLILWSITIPAPADTDIAPNPDTAATCEYEFFFDPAVHALRIHPSFKNFDLVRERIGQIREYGQPYVTKKELATLKKAFAAVEAERGDVFKHRLTVVNLINGAEDNLMREFQAHADEVEANLNRIADIVRENGDFDKHRWLTELILRIDHYRAGISIAVGAFYWQHARYEAAQIIERTANIPAWIQELRATTPKVAPRSTNGNFGFTAQLGIINHFLGQHTLSLALQRAYAASPPGDSPLLAWGPRMAFIKDLNRTLATMFLNPPVIRLSVGVVSIEGSVMHDGKVKTAYVWFDPKLRYLTVRTGRDESPKNLYYQLTIDEGGVPVLFSEPPLDTEEARNRLDLTHFAY